MPVTNLININTIKTMCMIFNKKGHTIKHQFIHKSEKLEIVGNFTYLGFCLSVTGQINDGLLNLHKRARKAFYKLKNHLGYMSYENPNLTIKLFDSLVKPVLLYHSDFWGCFEFASSHKSPLEKLNTTYLCKYLLGVKEQVSNVASKIEMGRFPLHIDAIRNCIKNWQIIQYGDACNIFKINFSKQ